MTRWVLLISITPISWTYLCLPAKAEKVFVLIKSSCPPQVCGVKVKYTALSKLALMGMMYSQLAEPLGISYLEITVRL